MKTLSTGDPSTLGSYLKLSKTFFGEDSKATKFIEDKISKSKIGEDEEVIAEEGQMVHVLRNLASQDQK